MSLRAHLVHFHCARTKAFGGAVEPRDSERPIRHFRVALDHASRLSIHLNFLAIRTGKPERGRGDDLDRKPRPDTACKGGGIQCLNLTCGYGLASELHRKFQTECAYLEADDDVDF